MKIDTLLYGRNTDLWKYSTQVWKSSIHSFDFDDRPVFENKN